MKNDFIISTTNNIEGCPIKKYIDTICTNIVIGTNIFSDFAASFTDFFGGRSDSYKNKLEIIYNEASKELKQKAFNLGANAIIGFRVDFDEISGKDKSMFMVSVSGTACIIERNEVEETKEDNSHSHISLIDLQKEIQRRYIVSRINHSSASISEWVEFLLENPQIEIIESLIKRYISLDSYNANELSNINRVLSVTPANSVIPIVYRYFKHNRIRDLIKKCRFFDAEAIYKIVKEDIHEGIDLLSATKDYYDANDLQWMSKILHYLNSLPDTGKIEVVKGGVFSRDNGEKFICENGHKNSIDSVFCEKCEVNIKGLNVQELDIIEALKEKCNIIEQYIK